MKANWLTLVSVMALVSMSGAGRVWGAEASVLTRAQWLQKIGESVKQETVLRETLAQVAPEDRVEFTRRMLRAVKIMPVTSPDEKAAAFVRTAVACIAGISGDVKYKVIAEVFACVPVEYLPVVTEELAKRFDQEYNKLSDAQYEEIASAAVKAAVARNAQTDEPSVRNTFVILAFLRSAKSPDLEKRLMALLPDDRMRGLVASWLQPALKDRTYDGLLAAADVTAVSISPEVLLRLVGHSSLDRLLAAIGSNDSLSRVIGTNLDTLPVGTLEQPSDFGVGRVPDGYQNQSTSIRPPDDCTTCDECSICIRNLFK